MGSSWTNAQSYQDESLCEESCGKYKKELLLYSCNKFGNCENDTGLELPEVL